MDHNPYTPPQARTEAPIPREPVRRPVAVWFLMAFLLMFAVIFIFSTVQLVRETADIWGGTHSDVPAFVSLLWHLALVVIFCGAAYGAFRRHRWSRWFGVALLAIFAAMLIFGSDTAQYENDAERLGGRIGRILLPLLIAWWIYALTLSRKAKRYFSKDSQDEE